MNDYNYRRYKKALPANNTRLIGRKSSPYHEVPPKKEITSETIFEEKLQKEMEDDLRVIEAINRLKEYNKKNKVALLP